MPGTLTRHGETYKTLRDQNIGGAADAAELYCQWANLELSAGETCLPPQSNIAVVLLYHLKGAHITPSSDRCDCCKSAACMPQGRWRGRLLC